MTAATPIHPPRDAWHHPQHWTKQLSRHSSQWLPCTLQTTCHRQGPPHQPRLHWEAPSPMAESIYLYLLFLDPNHIKSISCDPYFICILLTSVSFSILLPSLYNVLSGILKPPTALSRGSCSSTQTQSRSECWLFDSLLPTISQLFLLSPLWIPLFHWGWGNQVYHPILIHMVISTYSYPGYKLKTLASDLSTIPIHYPVLCSTLNGRDSFLTLTPRFNDFLYSTSSRYSSGWPYIGYCLCPKRLYLWTHSDIPLYQSHLPRLHPPSIPPPHWNLQTTFSLSISLPFSSYPIFSS